MSAPCLSPKAATAEGNPYLKLSCSVRKGGKRLQEDIPVCTSVYVKVLTHAYRFCIIEHQSFREFNTEISSVSLNEAKEKQKKFFPKATTGNYYIKKLQNALDHLPEQGSTRTDLKQIGESTHSKNWKGKTNHTFYQQVLKPLYKYRHGSDMDVTCTCTSLN